jgi:hypothetical protein
MKTILLSFLFLVSIKTYSQTTDIIYVPTEKTAVVSLKYNFSPIGIYAGGYVTKDFPIPFTYTTPMSIINRVGLTITGSQNKWGVMAGVKVNNYQNKVELKPDMWINFYPLRTLLNTPNGFDFIFSLNYQHKLSYGVGLSIPFGGIY